MPSKRRDKATRGQGDKEKVRRSEKREARSGKEGSEVRVQGSASPSLNPSQSAIGNRQSPIPSTLSTQHSALSPRRVAFVTGTRAEFGLMRSVLAAIEQHPRLKLQIIATGMHLDRDHGYSLAPIRREHTIDAIIPWKPARHDKTELARQTGLAAARLAAAYERLQSDIVLVVGDRVEAFAAASAAHLSGRILAHIHGGDRALGQVDDALRHAITKLAHLHFPATRASAERIKKLGEHPRHIHTVGSPGIDGITSDAWPPEKYLPVINQAQHWHGRWTDSLGRFALVLLHPVAPEDDVERRRARLLLTCVREIGFEHVVVIWPNNDPGCGGIMRAWQEQTGQPGLIFIRNAPRGAFLGLLRDAVLLVGNSSSGIIEAASFGTPVIDLGDRQKGRERNPNVLHTTFSRPQILRALKRIWNNAHPIRFPKKNLYGTGHAGESIAQILARTPLKNLSPKLITY